MSSIRTQIDGLSVEIQGPSPTTTLLQWLRQSGRTATKEGCAEGDCGACTVLLGEADGSLRAVNACLILLPQVDGLQVWTAQGLARGDRLHPVQEALVEGHGSQCGYCTPGFVMSLCEAAHRPELKGAPPEDWRLQDQLCGNLCRCTGYAPIKQALVQVAGTRPDDGILPSPATLPALRYAAEDQEYLAPDTLQDALAVFDARPEARIVAGATDLGLDVTQRHVRFPLLLDLGRIRELRGMKVDGPTLRIGATTPLTDLEAWSAQGLPVLHRMLRYFGSRQIKHRATLGGNLCNASPIGDLAPVLLALDAQALVAGPQGQRRVPMAEFFPSYRRTALGRGELLIGVELSLPSPETRLGAHKVSRRRELDISAVSACFAVQVQEGRVLRARLAFGGVAATPVRALAAEQALEGGGWTQDRVEAAIAALPAQVQPLDDHRGSARYRRRLAGNLLRGFFEETRTRPFVPLGPGHAGTLLLVEEEG